MKIAAAFFGFLAFCCLVVAAFNVKENPLTAFTFSATAVLFFVFSSFCCHEIGREKERGRVLTEEDLEDNFLYKIVQVFSLDGIYKPYRSIAVMMNFETKEEKVYKLRFKPHPLVGICRGQYLKNFAALNVATEEEIVTRRL